VGVDALRAAGRLYRELALVGGGGEVDVDALQAVDVCSGS
jgi:hypothetical protein